jgi:hydrogenase-4 component B
MVLTSLAAVVLLAGIALTLALRDNVHRAWASIASQACATVLVLIEVVPLLLHGGEAQRVVSWSYPIEHIATFLDPLSAFFLVWSLPMTLLGTIYALGYLRPYFASRNAGVQFALLNLTALSFVLIYTLQNALVFLLGWEIAAVAAWLLVIWDYGKQQIRFAGFNYLVSTHVGLFLLVAAFMVMHSQTGSLDFQEFAKFLHTRSSSRDVTFILLITSFGLKSAFFPFHTWLPRAHSAAPAHVSALMSGVIHKAGLYGLLRFTLLMGAPDEWMGWYLVGFSALSALFGVLYTTAQRDLKRMLGYSSTENVGIAGLGFGVGYLGLAWNKPVLVVLGFTGGILHILNHALFKCLLFYTAGAVYRATRSVDLERLGGLARRMPWTAGFFLLGGLAISALPPLNGFVSEFLIYSGLLGHASPLGLPRVLFVSAAALLAFVGAVSALAITRSYGVAFLGSPRDESIRCEGETRREMLLPMAAHAIGIIALGLLPSLGLAIVRWPAQLFWELLPPSSQSGPMSTIDLAARLRPISFVGVLLIAVLAGLLVLRRILARGAVSDRQLTWGCGYSAPSPRMQYTGTSFSLQFAGLFEAVLIHLRRGREPEGDFPQKASSIDTHCVDAVEHRMFELLGEGDDWVTHTAARIPEEPRVSFGVGLVVLLIVVGVVLANTGGAR